MEPQLGEMLKVCGFCSRLTEEADCLSVSLSPPPCSEAGEERCEGSSSGLGTRTGRCEVQQEDPRPAGLPQGQHLSGGQSEDGGDLPFSKTIQV